ncbi:MAG: winged helix-turn-helix transcriptional regulator [Candidatus Thermoplasmatota archaeon]
MSEPEIEVENRKKIYEVIEEYPGLHMREIKRKVGLSMNLVRYHLNQLKKYRLVSEEKEDEYNRYYPNKGERKVDLRDRKMLGILRKKIPLSIVLFLLNEDGSAPHGEIKDELEIPSSTLSYHLKKMVEKGVLEKVEGEYRLTDPDGIMDLLITYEPPQDIVEEFIDLWENLSL